MRIASSGGNALRNRPSRSTSNTSMRLVISRSSARGRKSLSAACTGSDESAPAGKRQARDTPGEWLRWVRHARCVDTHIRRECNECIFHCSANAERGRMNSVPVPPTPHPKPVPPTEPEPVPSPDPPPTIPIPIDKPDSDGRHACRSDADSATEYLSERTCSGVIATHAMHTHSRRCG